jgi:FkbH-like protein
VLDLARVASEVGLAQWYDQKLAVLARSPIGGAAQLALGRLLARHVRAVSRPPCKCLVLDLDNTLWGGVLGEEGIGGISLGEEHPGSIFKAFQRGVLGYRDRGVLLAIASKNNAPDVDELFVKHADMVLRREDFAARQIHWNDKATSLRAIAKELDIGVDSLAFFDDNPVERAWVREQLPEVTVIDVPKEPLRYLDALDESGAFDQLSITAEDRQRAGQYQVEAKRAELESTASSLEEFLGALQVKVMVGTLDAATLPRAVQLIGKTNQFNLTTRRHTAAELGAMLERPGAIGLWMRVADKFGDSGLVGVGVALPSEPATYVLDTFLLSCRVLGRKAERALLYALARRARAAGAAALLGEFVPTKKNAVAAGFFADAGFGALEQRPNWWRLELGSSLQPPALVELLEEP